MFLKFISKETITRLKAHSIEAEIYKKSKTKKRNISAFLKLNGKIFSDKTTYNYSSAAKLYKNNKK
jgi:hypothetical protein